MTIKVSHYKKHTKHKNKDRDKPKEKQKDEYTSKTILYRNEKINTKTNKIIHRETKKNIHRHTKNLYGGGYKVPRVKHYKQRSHKVRSYNSGNEIVGQSQSRQGSGSKEKVKRSYWYHVKKAFGKFLPPKTRKRTREYSFKIRPDKIKIPKIDNSTTPQTLSNEDAAALIARTLGGRDNNNEGYSEGLEKEKPKNVGVGVGSTKPLLPQTPTQQVKGTQSVLSGVSTTGVSTSGVSTTDVLKEKQSEITDDLKRNVSTTESLLSVPVKRGVSIGTQSELEAEKNLSTNIQNKNYLEMYRSNTSYTPPVYASISTPKIVVTTNPTKSKEEGEYIELKNTNTTSPVYAVPEVKNINYLNIQSTTKPDYLIVDALESKNATTKPKSTNEPEEGEYIELKNTNTKTPDYAVPEVKNRNYLNIQSTTKPEYFNVSASSPASTSVSTNLNRLASSSVPEKQSSSKKLVPSPLTSVKTNLPREQGDYITLTNNQSKSTYFNTSTGLNMSIESKGVNNPSYFIGKKDVVEYAVANYKPKPKPKPATTYLNTSEQKSTYFDVQSEANKGYLDPSNSSTPSSPEYSVAVNPNPRITSTKPYNVLVRRPPIQELATTKKTLGPSFNLSTGYRVATAVNSPVYMSNVSRALKNAKNKQNKGVTKEGSTHLAINNPEYITSSNAKKKKTVEGFNNPEYITGTSVGTGNKDVVQYATTKNITITPKSNLVSYTTGTGTGTGTGKAISTNTSNSSKKKASINLPGSGSKQNISPIEIVPTNNLYPRGKQNPLKTVDYVPSVELRKTASTKRVTTKNKEKKEVSSFQEAQRAIEKQIAEQGISPKPLPLISPAPEPLRADKVKLAKTTSPNTSPNTSSTSSTSSTSTSSTTPSNTTISF